MSHSREPTVPGSRRVRQLPSDTVDERPAGVVAGPRPGPDVGEEQTDPRPADPADASARGPRHEPTGEEGPAHLHERTREQSQSGFTEVPDVPRPLITEPANGLRKVRGFEIMNSLAFARKRAGRAGLVGSLRRLGPDDLTLLTGGTAEGEGRIRRLDWVPFALHCRVMRAVDAELGEGDLSVLFDIGQFMAERDLPTLFRPLFKIGRPGWIIDAGTRLWRIYHHEGTWRLERSPGELIARLEGLTEVDEAYCRAFLGWITRGMELSGAVDVEAYHPICQARGGTSCVFTGRWTY